MGGSGFVGCARPEGGDPSPGLRVVCPGKMLVWGFVYRGVRLAMSCRLVVGGAGGVGGLVLASAGVQ